MLALGGFGTTLREMAGLYAMLANEGEAAPIAVLRDAADNPANSVHYYDDGRWPEAADAGEEHRSAFAAAISGARRVRAWPAGCTCAWAACPPLPTRRSGADGSGDV